MDISNCDGLELLKSIPDNTIDLVLTDPPYIISRDSGMNSHYNKIKKNQEEGNTNIKTEADWLEYKKTLDKPKEELDKNCGKGWSKSNYLKYGTILNLGGPAQLSELSNCTRCCCP